MPWQRFTYKLVKYYKGRAQMGRPPIEPSVVLRMLLLSYLYNLSESQVASYCQENLPAKYFLGLAIDDPVPDHSTLTVFKNRTVGGKREAQSLHQAVERHHRHRLGERGGIRFVADTDTELYVSSIAPTAWPT